MKKILQRLKFNYVIYFIEEWNDLDVFLIDEYQGPFLIHE